MPKKEYLYIWHSPDGPVYFPRPADAVLHVRPRYGILFAGETAIDRREKWFNVARILRSGETLTAPDGTTIERVAFTRM